MTSFVLCHHGERSDRGIGEESRKYSGLTENGVIEIGKKMPVLVKTIEEAPNGSVIILGGCSKAVRTKSTLDVFMDQLRQLLGDKKEIVFSEPFDPKAPFYALKEVSERMRKDKKAIVDFPLTIEEFIAMKGQKECAVARGMLTGLRVANGFFRRFLPPDCPIIIVSAGHSEAIASLIDFLHKQNGKAHSDRFSFYFM